MLKWLKKNGCSWNERTFTFAAQHGSLKNMIWIKKNEWPWNERTFIFAAEHGGLENLSWLMENGVLCLIGLTHPPQSHIGSKVLDITLKKLTK